MGCFTVLKGKKKRPERSISFARISPKEQMPAVLPEPKAPTRSLQSAPPSFSTRVKPVQPENKMTSNRARALSAPESFDASEQDSLVSVAYDENDRAGGVKEQRPLSPQPLPLPSPHVPAFLRPTYSFKSGNGSSGSLTASGPLPLPPCVTHNGVLKNFSYEELSSACHNFSSNFCVSEGLSSLIYRASFGDDTSGSRKFEANVTRLIPSSQSFKEFINEVNTLAALQHPNLCKLLGYHARDGSEQRMLVFERLYHGSLDRLIYGRSDGPPLDWNTRIKIALCAAQGLTFLHEEGPFQAMYNEFSTANIQIDKDFSAKLSGYGCVGHIPETQISNSSLAIANLSVETLERGLLTPKSNVWSFGIVLLELLTGRKNLDTRHPKEERNLVKWSRPFLADDCRLSLIMDSQLKGRFPSKAARTVADVAQRCLQKDPVQRPTMRTILEHLRVIQDMKFSCRFPLQEPATVAGKNMSRSPSLNGIIIPAPRSSLSPSPPSRGQPITSSTRLPALPLSLPPRACSSTISLEEPERPNLFEGLALKGFDC